MKIIWYWFKIKKNYPLVFLNQYQIIFIIISNGCTIKNNEKRIF